MKLIDFLILMLEAQAEVIRTLLRKMNEKETVELLEKYHSDLQEPQPPAFIEALNEANPLSEEEELPFPDLDQAIRKFNFSFALEDQLISFPLYRAYLENCANLNGNIQLTTTQNGESLIEEALFHGHSYYLHLPIPRSYEREFKRDCEMAWLRFRTQTLKRMGKKGLKLLTEKQ